METVFKGNTIPMVDDNLDGTHVPLVKVIGGGGGGAKGIPVVDNAGTRWLWLYDATTGASTYISFATQLLGTPTQPIAPDADTMVAVSNFPETQPLPAGAATAANQVTQIGYLADLADANDRHATYKLVQSEDLGTGTKYILKSNGAGWLMIRKTYTNTSSTLAYAGPANNTGVPLAQAWAQRASLVYAQTVGGA